MADESPIPERILPALRSFAWVALPFIFFLVAVERLLDERYYQAVICLVLTFLSIVVTVKWNRIFRRHTLTTILWAAAILGLMLFSGAIGALLVRGRGISPEISTQTTASVPQAQPGDLAPGATLRLLIRPNQDPQELVRDNVWRWFVFKTINRNPTTGETIVIGTYIFLTFDHPIQTNYRRVFSPSNPNLRFDLADLNSRSMIVVINDTDLTGQTIEIQVSANPL